MIFGSFQPVRITVPLSLLCKCCEDEDQKCNNIEIYKNKYIEIYFMKDQIYIYNIYIYIYACIYSHLYLSINCIKNKIKGKIKFK